MRVLCASPLGRLVMIVFGERGGLVRSLRRLRRDSGSGSSHAPYRCVGLLSLRSLFWDVAPHRRRPRTTAERKTRPLSIAPTARLTPTRRRAASHHRTVVRVYCKQVAA